MKMMIFLSYEHIDVEKLIKENIDLKETLKVTTLKLEQAQKSLYELRVEMKIASDNLIGKKMIKRNF
mgnify:CR=1 FL=1